MRSYRCWMGLLLLLAATEVQAQPSWRPAELRKQDSVLALVRAHPQPDTVRLQLLLLLVDKMVANDAGAAGPTLRQALRLAQQLRYRDLLAETQLSQADYYITLVRYDSALFWLRESRAEFARLSDLGGQMRCLGRRARIADQQGRYAAALDYAFRGMAISDSGYQRRFHTSLTIQVAAIYSRLGEYALARSYLLRAMKVSRHFDYPDRLNLIYGELGELSRRQQQWPAARRYYAESRAVSQQLGEQPEVLRMDLNLAEMSEQLGHLTAARQAAYGILRRAEASHRLALLPRVLALLARTSLATGRADSAVWYGQHALRQSQLNRAQEGLQAASAVLAQAYARRGDFARAYQAQVSLAAYTDSLGGAALMRRTGGLQLDYERRQQRAQLQLQAQQQELERLRQQRRLGLLGGAVLLLTLAAAALLWTYRQRQRRREMALRTSIAADLHDEVGSMLTQISMQSTLLREGLYAPAQQQTYLDQMQQASQRAARQMSDVVWSIDARHDSATSLLDRLRDHAHEVLPPAGVELDFAAEADVEAAVLPLATRQTLYYIYKEALHNVVKHAQARQVRVRLRRQGPGIELEVSDDGQGLHGPGKGRAGGQGLLNMQMRAAALGGSITFSSAVPGTRVVARLPLR
jgi:signal transduction histidine kinase